MRPYYGLDQIGRLRQKTKKRTTRPRIEPPVKIIPGKHRAEFKKASEID
ncbi:MAG: hypothetical protein ACREAX_03905 [Candidatus Nitrosotenuis sp.]